MSGGMLPIFYQRLIEGMGYEVDDLIEWKPLVIGERLTTGTMTDPDPLTRFNWGWGVQGFASNMFECGVSPSAMTLWAIRAELVCLGNKLKPAHTAVIFNFY